MITTIRNEIVDQLCYLYYNEEWWQDRHFTKQECFDYHAKMLDNGVITVYEELGVVLGYIEIWKINFEQFGRLICHAPFNSNEEDLLNGNVAFVANVWIDKKFRNSYVTKALKLRFFKKYHDCDYYVGSALRKKTQPIKVFTRENLKSMIFREGMINGD